MQYIVWGDSRGKSYPEYELLLNKLLTGYKPAAPLPAYVELTAEEKETAGQLIQAVLCHWTKLGNTSPEGLQEAYLQRNGVIRVTEEYYTLTVESKAYDMLLDSIPWTYTTLHLSWMQKRIQVQWR